MAVRILDLDGGLTAQKGLREYRPRVVPLRSWGPRIRLACSRGRFRSFESELAQGLGSPCDRTPTLTLYGSGDFHHVSLALLRRLEGPFNLLVLDKHPDWMRGLPFLHCGTWLAEALRLPGLKKVYHLGGELDFDNSFRWLAPWPDLRSGRIVVLPAIRCFRGGAWRRLPHQPLRRHPELPVDAGRLEQLLAPHREDLARWPLYVTLDKDVMTERDAVVNWDSGLLNLEEVLAILQMARRLAAGPLAGMDIVGDWSPVQVEGWFRTWWHLTEHPALRVDPLSASRRNETVNRALLAALDPILTSEESGGACATYRGGLLPSCLFRSESPLPGSDQPRRSPSG